MLVGVAPDQTEGYATFHQGAVAIMSCMVVISGIAITYRCEDRGMLAQLIVGIHTCLEGEQAFRLVGRFFLEGLYMKIAQVAAQGEARGDGEVLSDAIEEGTGESLVQSHVVRSHTYYIIGASVAESQADVHLGGGSEESHQVDARLGVHIDETDLVGDGIPTVVDETDLHTPWMTDAGIEQANL